MAVSMIKKAKRLPKKAVFVNAVNCNGKKSKPVSVSRPRPKLRPVRTRTSSWQRTIQSLRKQIRGWMEDVREAINVISASVTSLTSSVSRQNAELSSLQSQVARNTQAISLVVSDAISVLNLLERRVNTSIIVETNAGPIAGIVLEVGDNYITVQEPTGALVLIPVLQISSFV